MRVFVTLQLTFKDKAPHGDSPFSIDLPRGTTVAEALEALDIPSSTPKVILVNGRVGQPARELMEDDHLTVFPPLEGG